MSKAMIMQKDRMTVSHEGAASLELTVGAARELPVANRSHVPPAFRDTTGCEKPRGVSLHRGEAPVSNRLGAWGRARPVINRRSGSWRGRFATGMIRIAAMIAVSSMGLAADLRPANVQKSDGSIVLLATNAVVHGQNIRYEPPVHKNTIGYWTRADDWVSWDFQVNTPGQFDVMLTQSCGQGSGGSEVAIRVGEQVIKDLVPDTGSFTSWTNRVIGTFSFQKPGAYTVEVKPLKKPGLAVMDLRAITLTPKK